MKPKTHPLRHLTLALLLLMMVCLPGLINTAQADTVGPIKSMPPHPVGHNSRVNSVAFSPDGRYALSGSWDKTLKLWDIALGSEIRTFTGHTHWVNSVAFSPDGHYALSGSDDDTLKLWDVATGAEIRTFTGHTWGVSSVAFSPDGRYAFSGSYDRTLKMWETGIPREDSLGKAIIIAAGGAQPNNTLYDYSNDFTQRLYRLLIQRGFSDEDIYYMNPQAPDIDLDGYLEKDRVDYQFFDPEQELEDVFTQVAGKLWPGQQFIFFLHGHARQDHFLIRPDYELTASHLQNLLARLPTNVQQILILDSCYSGSFFNELTGVENRILISSADDHTLSWNTEFASFTDTFLRSLRRGTSLHDAFLTAEELIKGDDKLFRNQQPWLDDDGDGLYTSLDGTHAAEITLAGDGIHAAPPPTITKVHPRQSLAENVTDATLWVRTTPSADGIRQVRAILIKPDFTAREYQGLDTPYEQPTLELIYNPAQDRYELSYEGFSQSGRWEIVYQAQNKEGVWSDKVKGEIQSTVSPLAAFVRMELNQSRYTADEPLRLDMVVNGQARVDLYVALIFPDGNFQTITYPLNLSFNNTIEVYQPNVEISGQKTYPIMELALPKVPLGDYMACGVLVSAGSDPHDEGNWIHKDCLGFKVY
jgi:hypothetical protein